METLILSLCLPHSLPQGTFLFSVINWSPLKLGKGLVAPPWATALGWLLALSSVSLLPIWAIYCLVTTPGTLSEVERVTERVRVGECHQTLR